MRLIFTMLLLTHLAVPTPLIAYDAVIKDERGRIIGYLDKDGDKTYFIDTRGRRGNYIEPSGTIKDKHGREIGKVTTGN